MPSPFQLSLTSAQIEEALNKAHDSADAPASGSTNLVESGAIYSWVIGRTFERVSVPASSGATGSVNQMAVDSGFIYICVATNTWVRAALASW